jgi:hypothetical protein
MSFSNPASNAASAAREYVAALLGLLGDQDPLRVQEQSIDKVRAAVVGLDSDAVRRPEGPDKWSVLQVLSHLADAEMVNGYRLRLMVAEDNPPIPGFDQDQWADGLRYQDSDPQVQLNRYEQFKKSNIEFFRGLTDAERERVGLHSERGKESVYLLFRLMAAHDLVHLNQIQRIRQSQGE